MTSRVAETLASKVTGSVCVLDANFRSPALHSVFSVKNHYGMSDLMLQPAPVAKFAQCLGPANLWLMSCGSLPSKALSLVTSDLFRTCMAQVRAEFDYVLIDAPALSACADSVAVGHVADGMVMVVEAHSTHRETALKAAQDLRSSNVRLLGVVLNKRTFPIPDALYNKL
jgi:Mrp family chromosome partitioning ATPase